jgi:hypothetical protein
VLFVAAETQRLAELEASFVSQAAAAEAREEALSLALAAARTDLDRGRGAQAAAEAQTIALASQLVTAAARVAVLEGRLDAADSDASYSAAAASGAPGSTGHVFQSGAAGAAAVGWARGGVVSLASLGGTSPGAGTPAEAVSAQLAAGRSAALATERARSALLRSELQRARQDAESARAAVIEWQQRAVRAASGAWGGLDPIDDA